MAIYLAPAALGLGDLLVTLPVVQGLIASGAQTYLVLRAREHESVARRIPGLTGHVLEWEVADALTDQDTFIDLRDHPLQREHWWGSKPFVDAYPGWTINMILDKICRDKGLVLDFDALGRLNANVDPALSDRVALIPGSAVAAKCWTAASWLALRNDIERQGLGIIVIGQPAHSPVVAELVNSGAPWKDTPAVADALDVVASCAAAVSVDTGIMHLAVHQGVPTVGIFRPAPVYVRDVPHFRKLVATKQCDSACHQMEQAAAHHTVPEAGPEFQPNNWVCQSAQRCVDTVTPQSVSDALFALLAERVDESSHLRRIR
jgi:ADP-heptose:LPS heptosyltransferase